METYPQAANIQSFATAKSTWQFLPQANLSFTFQRSFITWFSTISKQKKKIFLLGFFFLVLSLSGLCHTHKMAPCFQCGSRLYIPSMCMWVCHKTPVPYQALVSLSNLWQSLQSQGLKDTRRKEKGSKSWRKINTALWNKKCRLFTFHWSDDAGETPQTGIKLKEYIFCVFSPQGQEGAKKKPEQTETNHKNTIKLLIHITNPHSNIIKFQVEWDSQ